MHVALNSGYPDDSRSSGMLLPPAWQQEAAPGPSGEPLINLPLLFMILALEHSVFYVRKFSTPVFRSS